MSGQQRKVYFTSGHGEKNITSAERDGYATIVEALKQENYGVETVVLAQTGSVPEDAAVVVVAGPQTDFFPPEVEALRTYLGKAGKVLLALDPPSKIGAPTPPASWRWRRSGTSRSATTSSWTPAAWAA